jgi:hypothetical protein
MFPRTYPPSSRPTYAKSSLTPAEPLESPTVPTQHSISGELEFKADGVRSLQHGTSSKRQRLIYLFTAQGGIRLLLGLAIRRSR